MSRGGEKKGGREGGGIRRNETRTTKLKKKNLGEETWSEKVFFEPRRHRDLAREAQRTSQGARRN